MKVVLFGVGRHINTIESYLQEDVNVLFYLDNNSEKQAGLKNGKKIYSLKKLLDVYFDYVIISALHYQDMVQQILEVGCEKDKVIPFFKENFPFENYGHILKPMQCMRYSMECRFQYRIEQIENKQKVFWENIIYEMADKVKKEKIELPQICTAEETMQKIIHDKVSISRYGDGEFQIILGAAKDVYQDDDKELGKRLQEILTSNLEGHIVALADDYGCMEHIREENKNAIRRYMNPKKRKEHYRYIDIKKQYYNAYISRPYVIYPHDRREEACARFDTWKKVWDGKKILFVEGCYTRMGVGNDLFNNAALIERIIAPDKNAFSVYQEILEVVLQTEKDRIVLIALGPTATVLAYDLAKEGYWAIDIGHLDLEYEWYLKAEGYSRVPNKYNNEVPGGTNVDAIFDEAYDKSIIKTIKQREER